MDAREGRGYSMDGLDDPSLGKKIDWDGRIPFKNDYQRIFVIVNYIKRVTATKDC